MNHWLENSKRNLLSLSKSESFSEALHEWSFTGLVLDYVDEEIECELCEHTDLLHHFEIHNTLTEKRLLVGSSCILKFSEINIRDSSGIDIIDYDERKFYLKEALEKKLTEIMLEPLRELWLKDKENRIEIELNAKALKKGSGISPHELLFLFQRMDEFRLPYSANRYKVSLRSYEEQRELLKISKDLLEKLQPALSSAQLKRYARVFGNEN